MMDYLVLVFCKADKKRVRLAIRVSRCQLCFIVVVRDGKMDALMKRMTI